MKEQTTKKSRTLAIILSVFLGLFAWLYTYKYKKDKIKFWVALAIIIISMIISEKIYMIVWFGFIILVTLDSILDKNKFVDLKKTNVIEKKSSEKKDTKWYFKPVGVASIIFFILLIIGIILVSTTDYTYEKNYLLINGSKPTFQEFYNYFNDGKLTDYQREELFKDMKYKWVDWEVYIKKSSDNSIGCDVLGMGRPLNNYSGVIFNEIGINIISSEKSKLINYFEGDKIRIEGQLESYGSLVNPKIIYIKNASIINPNTELNNSSFNSNNYEHNLNNTTNSQNNVSKNIIENNCEISPLKYEVIDYNISNNKLYLNFTIENTRNYPYLTYFEEDYYDDFRLILLVTREDSGKIDKIIEPNYRLSEYFSNYHPIEAINPMQKRKLLLIFDLENKNIDFDNLHMYVDKMGDKSCFLKLDSVEKDINFTNPNIDEVVVSNYIIPQSEKTKDNCGSSDFVINDVKLKSKIGSKEADGVYLILDINQNNYNESDLINSLYDLFRYNFNLSDKKGNRFDYLTLGNSIIEYQNYLGENYDANINDLFYNTSDLDNLKRFNPLIYKFGDKLRHVIIYDVPINNDYILDIGYLPKCNCPFDSFDCYYENCSYDQNLTYRLHNQQYYQCSKLEFYIHYNVN